MFNNFVGTRNKFRKFKNSIKDWKDFLHINSNGKRTAVDDRNAKCQPYSPTSFFYNQMIFVNLAVVNILLVELKGLDIDAKSPILLVDQTYSPLYFNLCDALG